MQRVVEENADGMPDWLEAEVERRAARVLNGEAKASSDPLLSLTASSDECRTLLRLLADEAARARAVQLHRQRCPRAADATRRGGAARGGGGQLWGRGATGGRETARVAESLLVLASLAAPGRVCVGPA